MVRINTKKSMNAADAQKHAYTVFYTEVGIYEKRTWVRMCVPPHIFHSMHTQSLEIKPGAARTASSHNIIIVSSHLNSGQDHLNKT